MRVSVIIAALDESQTVGDVVAAARRAASVNEVVVVSDGSRDHTGAVARQAGADVVIELARNVGKGGAVMIGADRATGDVVVLLDGDLIGLRPEHIDALLRPLRDGAAQMTIGLFPNDLMQNVMPSLSGQRAIWLSHLLRHPELRDSRFGLERGLAVIARREGWRIASMEIQGVSHRRKEEKYGLVRGYRAKLQAAEDFIVRDPRIRRRMSLRTLTAALVVLFMVHGISGLFIAQTSAGRMDILQAPHLHDRILLIAAHSDDELIAAGGYLATAVEAGSEVTVVIVTNGDGNRFSAAVLGRQLRPNPRAFIREGEIRQQESIQALGRLGLTRPQVIFMGFPDRGLNQLLAPHWSHDLPYVSPFTRVSAPPYTGTYRAGEVRYTGEDLVDSLAQIIARARPTILMTHSGLDEHADHKAVHEFVTLALLRAEEEGMAAPHRYGFVIHAKDFPRPLRYTPHAPLSPPSQLRGQARWLTFYLAPPLITLKRDAMRMYRSQYQSPYLRLLLSGFIRRNELFTDESEFNPQ